MDFRLTEEQRMLKAMVRELAQRELKPRAAEWEKTGEFPWDNIRKLAEVGIVGLTIPVEYGGGGGNLLDAVLAMEEVAQACYITAMALLGEIGMQTQALVHYGREEHKRKYLPRIARGEAMCAICMTEPDAGSDVAAIKTNAVLDGDHYIVNGTKRFISRGDVAEVFIVYTRFDSIPGTAGIGALLIEKGAPGFYLGDRDQTMAGEYLYELVFDHCRVPQGNVLVKEHGFRKMMSAFNGQRCLNGTICLGIAQAAFDEAARYAMQRKQFGQEIGRFQGIQWMLADMAIKLDAARLLIYRAAANAGQGFPDRVEAAMAKTYANEMAIEVSNMALQIHGTYGYVRSLPVERLVRAARFGAVAGGTPQIQRNIIAAQILKLR